MSRVLKIKKRNGKIADFDEEKITNAIFKAAKSVGGQDFEESQRLSGLVVKKLESELKESEIADVEQIQDFVEKILIEEGHAQTAKSYILYRDRRAQMRKKRSHIKGSVALPVGIEIEKELENFLEEKNPEINAMFSLEAKLAKKVDIDLLKSYKRLFALLKKAIAEGELPVHPDGNYLNDSELGKDIYNKKYYLKNQEGKVIEKNPEDAFVRWAAFVAAAEPEKEEQKKWAFEFYKDLYESHYVPGGRVLAGAGDLFRLKTLANCFVTKLEDDNIESIYNAAYDCARTYSYGGGIGVDISVLRPKDATVHNAADKSTGAVSFMELYSLTTGLIGQSGRRGALMLTLDVKHPDVFDFIDCKKKSNWITNQIVQQAKWSGLFNEEQLNEMEKQVRDNTQVRFANISLKTSDEFMKAVEEENVYGPDKILLYKEKKGQNEKGGQDFENVHYSVTIPSKTLDHYEFVSAFENIEELNSFLTDYGKKVSNEDLNDINKRNIFGDYRISLENEKFDLAIKHSGDFLLYFNQKQTGELKRMVKAREIWDKFVESNYHSAEPGLLFWTTMSDYSPSNYAGRPVVSTNPCGEVPLESGGACNLGSINLSMFVKNGYEENAEIDWNAIEKAAKNLTRFLDNVVSWNESLNALASQKTAAGETRRLGLGVMGIADMLNQLGIGYDSEKGIELIGKIMSFIANVSYEASAELSEEKGPSPIFNYENYSQNPFFKEALSNETKKLVKEKGLRNIAILSIAPTGSISNIAVGYKNGKKNYIGISSGIEPIFSLYYTRRSESFGNKLFKVFHSTVQAYLDKKKLNDKVKDEEIEGLKGILPEEFFRTAHFVEPEMRVKIQGICQKYIDHSISSTVNLPESVSPETISDIYLKAWKNRLKGITIYRDGSRYPILSVQKQQSAFTDTKNKQFQVQIDEKEVKAKGDQVVKVHGKLTTPFHILYNKENGHIKIQEIEKEEKTKTLTTTGEQESDKSQGGVCKIEFVDGKLVKSCED